MSIFLGRHRAPQRPRRQRSHTASAAMLLLFLSRKRSRMEKKRLQLLLMRSRIGIRNRSYLTRPALVEADSSPVVKLLECGNDNDYFSVMGLTKPAFNRLLKLFAPLYLERYPRFTKKGRFRLLTPHLRLALVLHWYNSPMQV